MKIRKRKKITKNAYIGTHWNEDEKKGVKKKYVMISFYSIFAKTSEGMTYHCKGFCRLWKLVEGTKIVHVPRRKKTSLTMTEDIINTDREKSRERARQQGHHQQKALTSIIVSQEKLKTEE